MPEPTPRPPAPAAVPSLSQTVDVETPELVVFSYTIAGIGARAAAAIIDAVICFGLLFAIGKGLSSLASGKPSASSAPISEPWIASILVLTEFAVFWGYYVLLEALADGQTIGKRLLRLRVVRDGGYSITFGASAIRNLIRLLDMQPVTLYGVGIASAVLSKTGKRLGDMAAGTVVVREAVLRQPTAPPASEGADGGAEAAFQTALSEPEFAVLARFAERRSELSPERRAALTAQIAQRLAHALPSATEGQAPIARLMRLYESELAARKRGVAARRATGAARERHAIVAAGAPRWNRFATRLADAQRRGLRSLGETGLRDFVAEYRELAADLARLRTASRGATAPEIFYLSRLVAGAHNLIYRGKAVTLRQAVRFLFVGAPAEVRRSWRPIALAALLLFGPAAIAYTAVVESPPAAQVFIPDAMLQRARDGVQRAHEGTGYIQDPQVLRPVMASAIIANNVQVTFATFAAGLTAGIGTVLLLVLNGVSIGGIFGLYASKGIATLLLAFVAPHGVLELTAICIAGGAGFLLAAALLLPGPRTRGAALVANGARAIRLIGASTVLLAAAGSLEGLVSPIPWWPLEGKLAVSGLTAVALVLYLRGGRRAAAPAPRPEDAAGSDESAPIALGL